MLGGESQGLDDTQLRQLEQAVDQSPALRTVVAMRDELRRAVVAFERQP